MITYHSQPDSPVVEISVEGAVSNRELTDAIERLRVDLEQHGKTRLIETIHDFTGIEPAAIWTDLRLGVPLAQKVTRVAVVADQRWIREFTRLGQLFTRAELKAFAPSELAAARTWIAA